MQSEMNYRGIQMNLETKLASSHSHHQPAFISASLTSLSYHMSKVKVKVAHTHI